jgi:hypothetical protein
MSESDGGTPASGHDGTVGLDYATPLPQPIEHATLLSRYDFATLAVRLLGLYLLLLVLPGFVFLLRDMFRSGGVFLLLQVGPQSLIIRALLGAVLLFQARRIGARLLPPLAPAHSAPLPRVAIIQLHGAAIATCGVILLAFRGIPGLVTDLWSYYNRPGSRRPDSFAQDVIDILIGLFLFFGASAIANYWDRTRHSHAESAAQPALRS